MKIWLIHMKDKERRLASFSESPTVSCKRNNKFSEMLTNFRRGGGRRAAVKFFGFGNFLCP